MPEADAENRAVLPVGEYLRSVRESRGLQLEDASQVTKIGKNYLVAIEEGHFDKLPNAAYIKGFLRLYAGYLSLSGDEVVRRYEQSVPSAHPQPEPGPGPGSEPERPSVEIMERAKLGGPGRWVIPLLLLCLVILAALFFNDGEEKRVRPASKPPEAPAALPAPVAVQPQRSSALSAPTPPAATTSPAPAPGAAATGTTAPAPAPAAAGAARPDGIILRLRFNQDSWLSITIDDSISQRYDLKAGDIIEWKAARSFVLDIGDGAAAEGELNGRPLKALGDPGKPAHVELKGS